MFGLSKGDIENDPAIYRITLDEKGFVKNVLKTKSFIVIGFNEAVLKATERSQPYPKDKNGNLPRVLEFIHHPKSDK